jgi:hypothetical protein
VHRRRRVWRKLRRSVQGDRGPGEGKGRPGAACDGRRRLRQGPAIRSAPPQALKADRALLHLNGLDVSDLQLIERKALLEPLLTNNLAFNSTAMTRAMANSSSSTPASLVSRAWSRRPPTLHMRPGIVAYGAKLNGLIARSSSSSAGLTRKAHGHISERCCWAITRMTASSSTRAVLASGCRIRCSTLCGADWID